MIGGRGAPGPGQKRKAALIPARAVVVRKAEDPEWSEVERLAAKLEPKVAAAILALLQKMKAGVDLTALAAALKAGDINAALALLGAVNTAGEAAAVGGALQDAVWAGGALALTQFNAPVSGVSFVFDRLEPRLISWLKGYSYNLIREIGDVTREAIQDRLITGFNAGKGPIDIAREVRGAIGLTKRQGNAVAAYRKELESFHRKRTAAGFNLGAKIDRVNGRQVFKPDDDGLPKDGILDRRLRDFRYDGQLKRAMETGKPLTPAQIDKMVAAYERKYLRYRSEVIARTETMRTLNYGVQEGWRQIIEGGGASESLVRRRWSVAKDERLCEVCAPIPRMNPKQGVAFGAPFSTPKGPVMLPPMHPNCRCSVFIKAIEPGQLEE